jgi:hypothetical protein
LDIYFCPFSKTHSTFWKKVRIQYILFLNILKDSLSYFKYILMNNIILSTGLFGSCYLFGKSLQLINESLLQNKNVPRTLHILNILTFMLSGSVVVTNYYVLYKQIKT